MNTQEICKIEGAENTCEIRMCSHCGQAVEDDGYVKDYNGNVVCHECIDDDYTQCCRCGEYFPDSCITTVNAHYSRNTFCVCDGCLESSDYFQCDHCGEWVTNEHIHTDDYDHYVCDNCYESCYYRCVDCGEIIHSSRAVRHGQDFYCESCAPDNSKWVHNYSYKPRPIFHGDQDNAMYMGVELEIDNGRDCHSCAEDLHKLSVIENLFYLKSDGSLDDGLEIVTHPCTLEYHMQHFPWDDISDAAETNGFRSHDTDTCGLHVHVSRDALGGSHYKQEAAIAKIVLLVDRFWDEIVRFSRRDIDKIDRWAAKPNADITSNDTISTAVDKVKKASSSRYRAVNLENERTIEFRMFRGTLNVNTIYATLQLVDHLCRFAMDTCIEDCVNVSWTSFIGRPKYPELKSYLDQRGLLYANDKKEEDK